MGGMGLWLGAWSLGLVLLRLSKYVKVQARPLHKIQAAWLIKRPIRNQSIDGSLIQSVLEVIRLNLDWIGLSTPKYAYTTRIIRIKGGVKDASTRRWVHTVDHVLQVEPKRLIIVSRENSAL